MLPTQRDRPKVEVLGRPKDHTSREVDRGSAAEDPEQEQIADLARPLHSEGVAEAWKDARVSVKALAEHLVATSHGIKHGASKPGEHPEPQAAEEPRVHAP